MASTTPSAVRSATGLLTSAQLQRCKTLPPARPMLLASQYAATSTTVIANVPRNPARTPARSQSSRGASVDNGWAIERSLFMVSSPVIRVVVGGANGRGSLGKGLIQIYDHASIVDVTRYEFCRSWLHRQDTPDPRYAVGLGLRRASSGR